MGAAKAVATPAALRAQLCECTQWALMILAWGCLSSTGPTRIMPVHRSETVDDATQAIPQIRGCLPAAVPIAVKSLWSASFLKMPPNRRGISRRKRPPSIEVNVLQDQHSAGQAPVEKHNELAAAEHSLPLCNSNQQHALVPYRSLLMTMSCQCCYNLSIILQQHGSE